MPGSSQAHWENIFKTRDAKDHSWHQSRPDMSLALLDQCGLDANACIIDVGAGDSKLVDELLDKGFHCVHALDISNAALDRAKARLGKRSGMVTWVVSDIVAYQPNTTFDAWHDRAAFHFLTPNKAVQAYAKLAAKSLRPGGCLIIGAFSLNGPKKCSGLDIRQYDRTKLEKVFAGCFVLQEVRNETHFTPAGQPQDFIFCRFQRTYQDV